MPKYRYRGDAPVLIPSLHRELVPGDEFETDLDFADQPAFELLKDAKAKGKEKAPPEPEAVA